MKIVAKLAVGAVALLAVAAAARAESNELRLPAS